MCECVKKYCRLLSDLLVYFALLTFATDAGVHTYVYGQQRNAV